MPPGSCTTACAWWSRVSSASTCCSTGHGERYFAEKLLDFELASNVGGWQWASGSGCDAAPYFRVFNPESQLKKFDLRNLCPPLSEWGTPAGPAPIVEHKLARQRAIDTYKAALTEG